MKEDYRDQKGLPFLETLAQDTTLRQLRMAPAFTMSRENANQRVTSISKS
jgi:hypothetical protein